MTARGFSSFLDALRHAARALRWTGGVALASILLAVAIILSHTPALVRALGSPRATDSLPRESVPSTRVQSFLAAFDADLAQIRGRSIFYIPPEPPPPPPPAYADTPREDPPPARYAGPGIIAIVGETVWFDNGTHADLGEAGDTGLRILALNPPWGARIEWRGVEFDVPLFERTTTMFLDTVSTSSLEPDHDTPAPSSEENHDDEQSP